MLRHAELLSLELVHCLLSTAFSFLIYCQELLYAERNVITVKRIGFHFLSFSRSFNLCSNNHNTLWNIGVIAYSCRYILLANINYWNVCVCNIFSTGILISIFYWEYIFQFLLCMRISESVIYLVETRNYMNSASIKLTI